MSGLRRWATVAGAWRRAGVFCALLLAAAANAQSGQYLKREDFLTAAFGDAVPVEKVLWVNRELRQPLEGILGHRLPALRIRYWRSDSTTAWILDEIGKEEPITIGVTITDEAIEAVRILEFRESRGWEVRYPFFTDQFAGASLDDRLRLDRRIDGITGATLSVRAVDRIARVALFLHRHATQTPIG